LRELLWAYVVARETPFLINGSWTASILGLFGFILRFPHFGFRLLGFRFRRFDGGNFGGREWIIAEPVGAADVDFFCDLFALLIGRLPVAISGINSFLVRVDEMLLIHVLYREWVFAFVTPEYT
jgi:hypothetical protein